MTTMTRIGKDDIKYLDTHIVGKTRTDKIHSLIESHKNLFSKIDIIVIKLDDLNTLASDNVIANTLLGKTSMDTKKKDNQESTENKKKTETKIKSASKIVKSNHLVGGKKGLSMDEFMSWSDRKKNHSPNADKKKE